MERDKDQLKKAKHEDQKDHEDHGTRTTRTMEVEVFWTIGGRLPSMALPMPMREAGIPVRIEILYRSRIPSNSIVSDSS